MMQTGKRFFLVLLCMALMFLSSGCQNNTVNPYLQTGNDLRVMSAIDSLKESWKEIYKKYEFNSDSKVEDKHLQIIHTNVINMKEDIELDDQSWEERFESIDYIVEFELLTNYFNSSPYYYNVHTNDCVVVYRDGRTEVTNSMLKKYSATTYLHDYSPMIESIEDLGSEYNQVIKLP